jgi:hypothetical protein
MTYYEHRRKAMFFAYAMGLSVKDIADALNISREETLRILREDQWMYKGLTRVREYDRQLFAKSQQLRQTSGPKSESIRMREKSRPPLSNPGPAFSPEAYRASNDAIRQRYLGRRSKIKRTL